MKQIRWLVLLLLLAMTPALRAQTSINFVTPRLGTGTLTASAATITTTCTVSSCVQVNEAGYTSVSVQTVGTCGTCTLNFEASNDGVVWVAVNLMPVAGSTAVASTSTAGMWQGGVSAQQFRVRQSARSSGGFVVTARATLGTASVSGSGGGGPPGGSDTQVQYNNAGALGGISGATSNGTTLTLVAPILGTPSSANLTNATGLPEAGLAITDVTTANVSATAHGFAPKFPNNTTTFLRGDGTYAVPPGVTAGTVTSVSVTTANGVSGTVATATTTPAISLALGAITPASVYTGTSGSAGISGYTFLSVETGSGTQRGIDAAQISSDNNSSRFNCFKARGSPGTEAIVVANDVLCNMTSWGFDGANYLGMAAIRTTAVGTIAATRVPTQMDFYTSNDALPSVLTLALSLKKDQSATFAGAVTMPTPFTLGATSVTATGTQLNYLASAGGTTGTPSTNIVFSTSPALVTPTLGVASATTINKVTITAPANGATLTIADGKTLTVNNSISWTGTDGVTGTLPSTTWTAARTDAGQTFTGTQVFGTVQGSSFVNVNSTSQKINYNSGFIEFFNSSGTRMAELSTTDFNLSNVGNVKWSSSSDSNGGVFDTVLARLTTASLRLGGAPSATPVNNTLTIGEASRSGTDSNVVGANGTAQSGLGTGTATPSQFILRSPVTVASGTGAQTYATGLAINVGTAVRTSYTVATLPSASTAGAGAMAFVTDGSTTVILGLGLTVVGGGANKVPVYSDGTNWIVGG